MRITKDYDTHTKDELLAEASARGLTSVNSGSLKADIVEALEDSDTAPEQPPTPLPPLVASKLPQVETPKIPDAPGDNPKDEDYNDGTFTKDDGEQYAVAIVENHPRGVRYFAKNSRHSWDGTEEEFRAQFSKK